MKKDTIRALVVALIMLVLYHLIAFLIPFAKTDIFWISYGFTLAAFAVVAASISIAFLKKTDAKSRFYGFPIARIGVIYGFLQTVLGLVVMALGCIVPWWAAVVVYAVGFGAAVIGLVGVEAVVEEIRTQDRGVKKDATILYGLQIKVNQLVSASEEPALKRLAEDLGYSDPVGSAALEETERDLSALVDELQSAVADGDSEATRQLCRRASAVLAERNRLCKLSKH